MLTLQDRIDEIAAQEREWMAQGHPVAVVSNTVAWWNERGIFTAADLDDHFAGDPHMSNADRAYYDAQAFWAGYEAWLDEQPLVAESIVEDDFPFVPIYAVAQQYQPGWM